MTTSIPQVVVICGGVGAARFLRGLVEVVPPSSITAIVNVADDFVIHGLHVSPDLDTIMYTLADAIDTERGWGLRNETWRAMESLERYGQGAWFSLGDQDLATHLQRTARRNDGATLSEVTAELHQAWDVEVTVLPVSNDPISTRVTRADTGEEIGFQEYFVGLGHSVALSKIRFAGIEDASPTPEVLAAIAGADAIFLAPSNPLVSIAPVLEVPGVTAALQAAEAPRVAVSPIVGGDALKGPAADMLASLSHRVDAAGVAALWSSIIDILLIDDVDAALARSVAEAGVVPYVTDTIMADPIRRTSVARSAFAATALPVRGTPRSQHR